MENTGVSCGFYCEQSKRPSTMVSNGNMISKCFMHTRNLIRDPGCDGSFLILLRLMSRISRDGIIVNCLKYEYFACRVEIPDTYDVREHGEIVVLQYQVTETRKQCKGHGKGCETIMRECYPEGRKPLLRQRCTLREAATSYLTTVLSPSVSASCPTLASSSAPSSPTSVRCL